MIPVSRAPEQFWHLLSVSCNDAAIDRLNVDGDTYVSPTDAVLVINYLNAARPAQLPAEYAAPARAPRFRL